MSMNDDCLCCQEAQIEYIFAWDEPSEHRKDQILLTLKLGLPFAVATAGIAVFNYFVWKKR